MVLGAVLRCWDLAHLPYTHDELSALLRIHPGLHETITQGVIALDTHPPGVQVFEWAWVRLFGMAEWVVKLPFIVASLAALALLYRFARTWAGPGPALVSLAVLSTIQYTVMYGQIARPYAAGLFTTALLADALTRYLAFGHRRSLVVAVLAAAASGYVHHFSLMLAALQMGTAFLLLPASARRGYLVAAAATLVLYAPNIPILFHQLGHGGLQEWLQPPGAGWSTDYLWWLAHCSPLFAGAASAVFIAALVLRWRSKEGVAPLWMIALSWGLLPLLVGYGYSLWRAPVLQYSVVLFSFPYLLVPALAGLRGLTLPRSIAVAVLLALVSTFTLITTRQHFRTAYRSKYEQVVRGVLDAAGRPDRLALVECPERMVRFYLRHWQADTTTAYIDLEGADPAQLDDLLRGSHGSVFYGTTVAADPANLPRIQRAFPFLRERHDLVEGRTFVLADAPGQQDLDDIGFRSLLAPQAVEGRYWQLAEGLPQMRDSVRGPYPAPTRWDLTDRDFGIKFEAPVRELITGPNDVLEAWVDGQGADLGIVLELLQGDSVVRYRHGRAANGFGAAAMDLAEWTGAKDDLTLRAYVWNRDRGAARIASVGVHARQGNGWQFGAFAPLLPNRFP